MCYIVIPGHAWTWRFLSMQEAGEMYDGKGLVSVTHDIPLFGCKTHI